MAPAGLPVRSRTWMRWSRWRGDIGLITTSSMPALMAWWRMGGVMVRVRAMTGTSRLIRSLLRRMPSTIS